MRLIVIFFNVLMKNNYDVVAVLINVYRIG